MPNFKENRAAFASLIKSVGSMNPLGAVEYPLNVYSPCWCGSKKKWKFCHKGRENLPRVGFGQAQSNREKFFLSGACQHPDASAATCSGPDAIQSHTVQRRGGLGAIAESGHVYSIKKGVRNVGKNDGQVDMEKLGVAKASIFPGYCSEHDTTLFKPVEMPGAILNDMNGFLLSLRAISYELATKAAVLRAHSESRESIDCGIPFEEQAAIQNYMHLHQIGLEKGLSDLIEYKSMHDKAFLIQDISAFSLYGVAFDGTLPFAAAGSFMPEFDFSGKKLQSLGENVTANQVAFNVTQLNGKTCAIFGWFGGTSCPASNLVASFKNIADEDKANAVLLISLEHLENVYFTPSWWNGLSDKLSTRLHQSIAGGMPGTIRSPDALVEPSMNALTYGILSKHEKYSM